MAYKLRETFSVEKVVKIILKGIFIMKKTSILLSLLLILLIFSTEKLFACDITFEPSAVKVNSNNTTSVTVTVELAHKNCPKELGDINFDYTGVKLIKKGEWKQVSKRVFEIVLDIKLTDSQGSIRIWRKCDKEGISEGIIKVSK
mgnify:CR=1 FL=1